MLEVREIENKDPVEVQYPCSSCKKLIPPGEFITILQIGQHYIWLCSYCRNELMAQLINGQY